MKYYRDMELSYDEKVKLSERSKELIGLMTSFFSMSHRNYPALKDNVKFIHRTEQGTVLRAAITCILALAENADELRTDARNEVACETAKKIRDFMTANDMVIVNDTVQLPYI